jgi:molecular chaperone GrpE
VPLELNSIDGLESAETAAVQDMTEPGRPAAEVSEAAAGAGADGDETAALLTEISAAVREVADLSRRYHTRAEQREGVVDFLRSELDMLRRGERRGLLRPVLAELCRLRDDLLSQATALPADFDAAKAAGLLRSYAETIELTLESNGVVTYAPDGGDSFDPRLHRRVGGEPTADPALAGHIAAIRRDGYLDIEANSPIAPAEVTVFAAAKAPEARVPEVKAPEPAITEPKTTESAAETTATEGEQ